jgi:hydrogenase maturation protease
VEVLVLGVGNLLLGDEGVGVHAVRALARDHAFPPEVELLDGGTAGMELLEPIRQARHLVVIDAVDAGVEPGTVVRLSGNDVPIFFGRRHLSPHQVGLSDVLAVARLAGRAPASVTVLGVQPASLSPTVDLTPRVAAALPRLLRAVVVEIAQLEAAPSQAEPSRRCE